MKYVDIIGDQKIYSISINLPELSKEFEYYYPDGIESGIFKKKTYFVGLKSRIFTGRRKVLYQTPQEAIEDRGYYFIREGKIFTFGYVNIVLKSNLQDKLSMRFEKTEELIKYLGELEYRWGVNLNSFVCIESSKAESLYEHKNKGFGEIEE